MACDIQNAYLTAPCREKIWTIAGLEFGPEVGCKMLVVRAHYVLKTSGAAFRSFSGETLYDMGYNDMILTCFIDASHASNQKDRRSQTGILIRVNKATLHWYSKRQNTVETSTVGAEFCAMKIAVEMAVELRYKMRMFGVPIDGAANVNCDNEAEYKNKSIPESVLKKKHHSIAYHRCREAVAAKVIPVAKQGTEKSLANLFTKVLTSARRSFLLERFTY